MWQMLKYTLNAEKTYAENLRLQNKFCIRWSRVLVLLLTFFYITSPIDFFPEIAGGVWALYMDDLFIGLAGIGLFVSDVIAAFTASSKPLEILPDMTIPDVLLDTKDEDDFDLVDKEVTVDIEGNMIEKDEEAAVVTEQSQAETQPQTPDDGIVMVTEEEADFYNQAQGG